MVDNKYIKIIC